VYYVCKTVNSFEVFERALIKERQRGAYCGRKKALSIEQFADQKSRVADSQPKTPDIRYKRLIIM
jgi:hypothetical protein